MAFRRPRNGFLATYRGRVYRCGGLSPDGTVRLIHDGVEPPPPEEGFTQRTDAEGWWSTVPAEQCDRVVEVGTRARLGQRRCQVMAIAEDGTAEVIGDEAPGWELVERGSYRTHVHVSELRDYHESHSDLLFDYWRDRTFGSGPQVRP